MRFLHALSASAVLLSAALLLAAPAAARSTAQAGDTGAKTSAPASDYATEAENITTGTILTPAQQRQKRFDDCMSIWEPATHMTKREWRRTCKSQLKEFPNL
jgi:hypothetical protein